MVRRMADTVRKHAMEDLDDDITMIRISGKDRFFVPTSDANPAPLSKDNFLCLIYPMTDKRFRSFRLIFNVSMKTHVDAATPAQGDISIKFQGDISIKSRQSRLGGLSPKVP